MKKNNQPISASTYFHGKSYTEKMILFTAFGFGSGLAKFAPGTWGTLPGLVLAYFLMPHPWLHLLTIAALTVLGIWLCQRASDLLKTHDHSSIVIDEIVGVCITLLFLPASPWALLLGFVFFRFFDIVKPWPIRWVDRRVHGGLGIMLDDIIAGVFAAVPLQLIWYYFF